MHKIQEKRVVPPTSALASARGSYKLDTEVCNVQLGCMLLQNELNDTTKPIYWSRLLTKAKQV